MFKKILVALDSSNMSQIVFERALHLAKTNQASLMLLHVLSGEDENRRSDSNGTENNAGRIIRII